MRLAKIVISILLLFVGISDVSAINCHCGQVDIFLYRDSDPQYPGPMGCIVGKEKDFDPSPSHGRCFITFEYHQCDDTCRHMATHMLSVYFNKFERYTDAVVSHNKTGLSHVDFGYFWITFSCKTDFCDVSLDAKESDLLLVSGTYQDFLEKVKFIRPLWDRLKRRPSARFPKPRNGSTKVRHRRGAESASAEKCYCGVIQLNQLINSRNLNLIAIKPCYSGNETYKTEPLYRRCFTIVKVLISGPQTRSIDVYYNRMDMLPTHHKEEDTLKMSTFERYEKNVSVLEFMFVSLCGSNFCSELTKTYDFGSPPLVIIPGNSLNYNLYKSVMESGDMADLRNFMNNNNVKRPKVITTTSTTTTTTTTTTTRPDPSRNYTVTKCYCGKMKFHVKRIDTKLNLILVNKSSCKEGKKGFSEKPSDGFCIFTYKVLPCNKTLPCAYGIWATAEVFFNNHDLYNKDLFPTDRSVAVTEVWSSEDDFIVTARCNWQNCHPEISHETMVSNSYSFYIFRFSNLLKELSDAAAHQEAPVAVSSAPAQQKAPVSRASVSESSKKEGSAAMYISLGVLSPIVLIAIAALVVLIALRKKLVQDTPADQKTTGENKGAQQQGAATNSMSGPPLPPFAGTPSANTPIANAPNGNMSGMISVNNPP